MLYQPFQDSLGQRIYEEISLDAWKEWIEHSKMIVNEYRLDLGTAETHTNLKKQCEEFLFGEEEKVLPPDFVPDEK